MRWAEGGSGGGMKMWIDWFEQGYQPRQHCRGFLKMTPGDGITRQFMQRAPSIEARDGGGRNRSERRGKVRFRSQKPEMSGKVTDNFFLFDVLQRFHSLGIVRVSGGWLVRRLAVYFFILPPLRPYFWLWLPVFMIKVNWQLNLIEFSRQWL